MEIHQIFTIDISDFEQISREVGFLNCKANTKNQDGEYDQEAISEYKKLRLKQLLLMNKLINFYSKQQC